MEDALLIIHGGGPTAVLNASLYGAVTEARERGRGLRILAARNGSGGALREDFLSLSDVPEERLRLLLRTPGSAVGTSRDPLEEREYDRLSEILKKNGVRCVLMNGGNGTMDACRRLAGACRAKGFEISVVGIPKTTDNDIALTDHSPGYGSAARFIARSAMELCADVRSLPIHVVILEASGRNAGWITAAAALARGEGCEGPDLIYLPERPFREERFLEDVSDLLREKKSAVAVVSEGLRNERGEPVAEPLFQSGRATYFGDVGSALANLVIRRLGYKARGEKPGLLGRCSISLQSPVDRREAEEAGRFACRAALEGVSGKMAAFRRISSDPYAAELFLADLEELGGLRESAVPDRFINEAGNGVTEEFVKWCRPLTGEAFSEFLAFN